MSNHVGGAGSGGNRSPGPRRAQLLQPRGGRGRVLVARLPLQIREQLVDRFDPSGALSLALCRTTRTCIEHAPRRCRCALLRRKEAVCDRRGIRAGHRQPLCSLDSLVATRPELMLRLDSSPMAVSGIEAVSHLGARRSLALGHRDELSRGCPCGRARKSAPRRLQARAPREEFARARAQRCDGGGRATPARRRRQACRKGARRDGGYHGGRRRAPRVRRRTVAGGGGAGERRMRGADEGRSVASEGAAARAYFNSC